MKITRSAKEVSRYDIIEEKANYGCRDKCPCCGKEKTGLGFGGTCKTWAASTGFLGFGKTKHMRVDCYSCRDCGAKWESDPYEYC